MLRIDDADPQGPAAMSLLAAAAVEIQPLYADGAGADPDAPPPANAPLAPRGVYLVAWRGDEPMGSAALRPIDNTTAEVRRVYVRRHARGSGVAKALMAALEARAAVLGYRLLRLETGNRQPAAIALYESLGYRHIDPFGAYVDDPTSVCFEKPLAG